MWTKLACLSKGICRGGQGLMKENTSMMNSLQTNPAFFLIVLHRWGTPLEMLKQAVALTPGAEKNFNSVDWEALKNHFAKLSSIGTLQNKQQVPVLLVWYMNANGGFIGIWIAGSTRSRDEVPRDSSSPFVFGRWRVEVKMDEFKVLYECSHSQCASLRLSGGRWSWAVAVYWITNGSLTCYFNDPYPKSSLVKRIWLGLKWHSKKFDINLGRTGVSRK